MSKYKLEDLVGNDEFLQTDYVLKTFTNKKHPESVKKVCPLCAVPFDGFLLCIGPLIGCTHCAAKEAARRGIEIKKEIINDLKAKALEEVLRLEENLG